MQPAMLLCSQELLLPATVPPNVKYSRASKFKDNELVQCQEVLCVI